MKIFVSYSRSDAGDFAEQIQKHFTNFKNYDVFTDVNNINAGEDWSDTIEKNISKCDIFVIIITYGALQSPHVKNEFLQAQREHKRIIPCFHKDVGEGYITWGLSKIQGVEFTDKYELARDLYAEVVERKTESKKDISGVFTTPSVQSPKPMEVNEVPKSKENTVPRDSYAPSLGGSYSHVKNKEKRGSKSKIVVPILGVVAVIVAIVVFAFPASTDQPFHFPTSSVFELNPPKTSPNGGNMNPAPPTSQPPQTSAFASGRDHGCADAKISDASDRYINQLEKGPSYHTEDFMQGYNRGYSECSEDDASEESEENRIAQNAPEEQNNLFGQTPEINKEENKT